MRRLKRLGTVIHQRWIQSLLMVSALLLVTAAAGKTVTYGLSRDVQAAAVVHQATHVPRQLALGAVIAELTVAAGLLLLPGRRRRYALLFLLCCCFLSYRLLTWGDGPCGCYVNPALLNSTASKALEVFAWASLLYMLGGSGLALLGREVVPAVGAPTS